MRYRVQRQGSWRVGGTLLCRRHRFYCVLFLLFQFAHAPLLTKAAQFCLRLACLSRRGGWWQRLLLFFHPQGFERDSRLFHTQSVKLGSLEFWATLFARPC